MKSIALLKKLLASPGKFTVTGNFSQVYRFPDVVEFAPGEIRFVERNEQGWWGF